MKWLKRKFAKWLAPEFESLISHRAIPLAEGQEVRHRHFSGRFRIQRISGNKNNATCIDLDTKEKRKFRLELLIGIRVSRGEVAEATSTSKDANRV